MKIIREIEGLENIKWKNLSTSWGEPSDRILSATSILDYIFRELAVSYLGREELAHTPGISGTSVKEKDRKDDQ